MHPYLVHIGHLTLPTFGLLAALGLVAALSLSLRTAATVGIAADALWDAGLALVIAAFVLSRLLLIAANLHSFLTYPILLLTVPSLTPLGLLLTAIAALVYLRLKHIPLRSALDAWAPCATLLWAFLALGHLAEGSDPGLPTTSALGLRLPPDPARLFPVSLYVALCALLLTALLLRNLLHPILPGPLPAGPGSTTALALVLAGTTQFLLTFLRQPAVSPDLPVDLPLDPIQWVALGLIAAGSLLYLTPQRRLPHAL